MAANLFSRAGMHNDADAVMRIIADTATPKKQRAVQKFGRGGRLESQTQDEDGNIDDGRIALARAPAPAAAAISPTPAVQQAPAKPAGDIDIYGSGADNTSNNPALSQALKAASDRYDILRAVANPPRVRQEHWWVAGTPSAAAINVLLGTDPNAPSPTQQMGSGYRAQTVDNPAYVTWLAQRTQQAQEIARQELGDKTAADHMKTAVQSVGIDPRAVPEGATFDMFNTISGYNGAGRDPLKALAFSALPNEAGVRDAVAWGLANNKPPAEIQKFAQDYAKSHKGGGVLRQVLGDDVMQALPTILAIAGNAFLPGLGTGVGAALGAGSGKMMDGGNIGDALKSGLTAYAGANLAPIVKEATGSLMSSMGDLGNETLNKIAGSSVGGGLTGAGKALITGQNVGQGFVNGAGSGAIGGATGAADRFVTSAASDAFGPGALATFAGDAAGQIGRNVLTGKDAGAGVGNMAINSAVNTGADEIKNTEAYKGLADSLNFDNFSIPGGIDLGGNLIQGLDSKTALQLASAIPATKPLASLVSGVKQVSAGKVGAGINTLVNAGKTPALPPIKKPPVVAKSPSASTVAAAQKPPAAVLAAAKKPATPAPAPVAATPAIPPAVLAAINKQKSPSGG